MPETDYKQAYESLRTGDVPAMADRSPLLTEVLTLSDPALLAFVECLRLNPTLTRDPAIIRSIFTAYVASDATTTKRLPVEGTAGGEQP